MENMRSDSIVSWFGKKQGNTAAYWCSDNKESGLMLVGVIRCWVHVEGRVLRSEGTLTPACPSKDHLKVQKQRMCEL